MENGSLLKVESIAECLKAFCNTFDLHLAIMGIENQFFCVLVECPLKTVPMWYFFCRSFVLFISCVCNAFVSFG